MSATPFLTAEWHSLAILNYEVDPALLAARVPAGTELDHFDGKTYISLVGFRFEHTRVRGLWIPFHSDFDEVNLRFYARHTQAGELRRGVVFVREVVPRRAIALVANRVFREHYIALPMRHRLAGPVSEGGRREVQYSWRLSSGWATLSVECEGKPLRPAEGSLDQFITEHYWGYTASPDGATVEYRVEHEPWRVWAAARARFEGDCTSLYGPELAACLNRPPDFVLLAEGSAVSVLPGSNLATYR
jgi:uncharacterized protein YqjF (DUF2071 family)